MCVCVTGEDALWVDGLSYVVSLCSELSLGGGEALAAGLHLLDEVVPKGATNTHTHTHKAAH